MDVLRGVAILGILIINIQSFGRLSSEFLNPKALGDPPMLDWVVWSASHILADEKFIGMLTLLFGAGIVLMAQGAREPPEAFDRRFQRRMNWLLVFGLAHGMLLWPGDILHAYALCGMIAVRLRHREPAQLAALGILLLAFTTVIWLMATAILVFLVPSGMLQSLVDSYWQPTTDVMLREVDHTNYEWLTSTGDRAVHAVGTMLWALVSDRFWRMLGLILLGMALMRTGFMTGRLRSRVYGTVAALGLAAGIPLILCGLFYNEAVDWDIRYAMFLGRIPNHWAAVAVSLSWISLVVLLLNRPAFRLAARGLDAVGRLAMTNYIGQTIICGALFYGVGLGLFLKLDYLELMAVTGAIWAFQILFSLIYRRFARMGPFEWAWRRLSA